MAAQPSQFAALSGLPPCRQMRRVEPLASQQRPNISRLGAFSACRRMSRLYSAVNVRRFGRAAGSGSSTASFWARVAKDAVVIVIGVGDPFSPCRDSPLLQVSHGSLTDRGQDRFVSGWPIGCTTG